jgi:hypothetical protein
VRDRHTRDLTYGPWQQHGAILLVPQMSVYMNGLRTPSELVETVALLPCIWNVLVRI